MLTFDCYGTLIDWEFGVKKVLDSLVKTRRLQVTADALLRKWGEMDLLMMQRSYRPYREIMMLSLKHAFEAFGLTYSERDGEALVRSLESWSPFPDVKSSLDRLRTNFKIGVITNIDNDLFEMSLRQLGTTFDYVLTAERARVYKPNHAIFRHALRELDRRPQEVLHVSFSHQYDLEPASALGFRTAIVRRTPVTSGRADYIAADLRALVELLHPRSKPDAEIIS